jgi:hypothetical protein
MSQNPMSRYRPLLLFPVLLVACNPYAPDLGDDPFQCGTDNPKCPEGYVAVRRADTVCVCQDEAPTPSNGFACNEDPYDQLGTSNGDARSATATAVGVSTKTALIDTLAICPENDEDFFSLRIGKAQTRIEALVKGFDPEYADLELSIVDGTDKTVQTGLLVKGENTVRVIYMAETTGEYFVRIKATTSGKNNYKLELQLVEPGSS